MRLVDIEPFETEKDISICQITRWHNGDGYADVWVTDTKDISTIDAVPVVHARWVDKWRGLYANKLYKCSACKETALADDKGWFLTDYGPNCGAKMDGERKE